MSFETADQFLRKYPNQWSDKNLELAKRIAKLGKGNVRQHFHEDSLSCQRHFMQQIEEHRYDEGPSIIEMDSPSSSLLDVFDNVILARPDDEAPTQERLSN